MNRLCINHSSTLEGNQHFQVLSDADYDLILFCFKVIHPAQLEIVQKSFSPSQERIEWATALIAGFRYGRFSLGSCSCEICHSTDTKTSNFMFCNPQRVIKKILETKIAQKWFSIADVGSNPTLNKEK